MKTAIFCFTCSLGLSLVCADSYATEPKFLMPCVINNLTALTNNQITLDLLKNATYQIPELGLITLTDGKYENDPLAHVRKIVTMSDIYGVGDINKDGSEDAGVILAVDVNKNEIINYLALVVIQDNQPNNINTIALGDRVQVKNITITNNIINLTMLKHSPSDPMCCPSDEVVQTYSFNNSNNELTDISLNEEEKNPDKPKIEVLPNPSLELDVDNTPDTPSPDVIELKL